MRAAYPRRGPAQAAPARAAEVTISGSIRVGLPVMAAAEDDFRQVLNAFEALLDQLDTELRASLSEWTGDAQAAYWAAHAQWREAAGDMASSLAWLHGVIVTAHGNYASARATNIGMWQSR
jgi:WXG100 family type VII secretion target